MIASLSGKISDISGNFVVVDVGGVGYEVFCSYNAVQKLQLGADHSLVIYTDVKEDSINLYGFEDKQEKQVFLLLLKVKGVGAKTASQIISRANKLDLLRAIGNNDLTKLQAVKGIGKKMAERIIVELRDQVSEFVMETTADGHVNIMEITGPYDDAIRVLQALGFSKKEAEMSVGKVRNTGGVKEDSGEIVKEALRYV